MSIKKLFDSNKPNDVLTSTNLEEEVVKNAPELESADNVREQIERINRFIPQVDFSDPANFAVYGSAETYYEDAITRIYREFPYDGSQEEVTRFHNESNYLDLYIFDSKYPRTNGYAKFAVADDPDATAYVPAEFADGPVLARDGWTTPASTIEYIRIFGGPNSAKGGLTTGSFRAQFTGSNYYDTDIYTSDGTLALDRVGTRESNLKFNLSNGVTTEFWINVNSDWPNGTAAPANQIIYDQWNGHASSSSDYGRLLIYLTGSGVEGGQNPIGVHLASGSNVWDTQFGGSTVLTGSLTDTWNHVALTFATGSTQLEAKFYLNGSLIQTNTNTTITSFGEVTGSLIGYVAAGQTAISGAIIGGTVTAMNANPFNPLSGSMDEFRYWKSARTEKDIQQNYWTHVRGGTNNEVANTELGVYYKFNEGITGTDSTDSSVLDYSGRISNGTWTNYPGSAGRSTDSAIVSASAATSEYKDPIIYSSHPSVVSLQDELAATGSIHDYSNQASIIDTIPAWIVEEEDTAGSGELSRLTQIMGSYMDTLNLQIESLPGLTNNTYLSSSAKPTPFMKNLLSSRGLAVPEIFVDADLLQRFANRDEDKSYSLDINEVKNLIYKNIYNNLVYLYKSKGTEKAFRNLIRCYGLGDDIVRFNAYSNNNTFNLEDTRQYTTVRKNYVDFNHPDRFAGVVYQNSSSTNAETGNTTYLSGATNARAAAETAEIEVVFPKKFEFANKQYFETPFITSSIFGFAQPNATPTNFTQAYSTLLNLYAVRTARDSKDVYFLLSSSAGIQLSSDVYSNVYDNQKWNFALRVKAKNWPYTTGSVDSADASPDDVNIELYGVNVENGIVRNQFTLSTSSVADSYLESNKRYQIGALHTDYTGSNVITKTDILASSLRVYLTSLENETVRSHALDPQNYGTLHPNRNFVFLADSALTGVDNQTLLESESLILNWDFSQVTSSDASGVFVVEDASSGSLSLASRYNTSDAIYKNLGKQFAGQGFFGGAPSSTGVISKQFVQSAQQRLPEVVNTSDAVNVLSRDDELYPRDTPISQTYFTFEKSMYGIVSQEILAMFSTVIEFNDLIGDIVHKYRGEYKSLRLLRELFFEKIQNDPDLDKFIDYYKWIDSSLSIFLQQFVPASADVSDDIRTIVEDYVLNRSKYQHQYPHLDYKGNERWGGDDAKLEARVKGIRELEYNWEFGHAPIRQNHLDADQQVSALWWKERAERDNYAFETSTLIDSARQTLLDIVLNFNSASADSLNTGAGATGIYQGSTYAVRRFTMPLKLTTALVEDIGGGYNYPRNQKPDALFSALPVGDASDSVFGVKKIASPDIASAELRPTIKQEKRSVPAVMPANITKVGEELANNRYLVPFIAYSSSASPANGFGQSWQSTDTTLVPSAEEFAGYHNDSYGDDYEVPMQGPFTNQHVGGNRHRHTDLNAGTTPDTHLTRPEAWNQIATTNTRFTAADTTVGAISTNPQYRRDQTAKRPVNIKNVQDRTGSFGTIAMGNFDKRYEIVQTSDRLSNNSEFVKQEGFSTASITTDLDGYIGGFIDYAKPVRSRREHVFVERFSAPGGPEVAGDTVGGPGLDYESGQYSPYNNLNYRNLAVRVPLRTLLTERSERFGLRSGSAVSALDYTDLTASFHKINRNPLHRIENPDTPITGTVFDNYYIQHMIPQSDFQYSWVTASTDRFSVTLGAANNIHGYFPYDGLARASSSTMGYSYVSAVNFESASERGSGIATTRQVRQKDGSYTAGTFVPSNFVGMNTNIIDKFNVDTQQMGFDLTDDIKNYINYGDIGHVAFVANSNSFIQNMTDNNATNAGAFNGIVHYRNGNYGHPTWKQIRVGQSQLARHYRKNNIYTNTSDADTTLVANEGTFIRYSDLATTLIATQSVVVDRYYPVVYELEVRNDKQGRRILRSTDVVVKASFVNDTITFDDNDFLNEVVSPRVIKRATKKTSYKQIIDNFSIYANLLREDRAILQINKLRYRETVYPPQLYSYTEKVRGRTGYENNFWRDARADRTTKGASKKATNSMGIAVAQSAWAMDAEESFTGILSYPSGYPTGGISANNTAGFKPGELQNLYTHFVTSVPDATSVPKVDMRPGALYARKQIMPFTSSVTGPGDMRNAIPTTPVVTTAGTPVLHTSSLGAGTAVWDAPTLAGRYEGTSSVFTKKVAKPFYDDYDKFFADIKAKAGGKSIIPEFRIGEHLDFYGNSGGDFLAENLKIFSIVGTPANSALPQNSDEENFFKIFTNSDFMKYFEVVRDDANKQGGILEPTSIKLRCKAIKKFVPYDGFYPAERTVQLAQQFSSSYTPYTNFTGADTHSSTGIPRSARFRAFLKPFFAPGIMYNTIKSGLAVDYPVMTGSYNTGRLYGYDANAGARMLSTASAVIKSNSTQVSQAPASTTISHNDGWDYRIPFEALVGDGDIYGKNIVDDEPSKYASMSVTASWASLLTSPRYKYMMHNFLAESLNMFIKNGRPTEILSAKQSEFKDMTPGQPYGMRIKLYRSLKPEKMNDTSGDWGNFQVPQYVSGSVTNFTMYSRPSAFGPPVGAGINAAGAIDHLINNSYGVTGSREFSPASGHYSSHTPPYYDGEAWVDIIYFPYRSYASASTAGNVSLSAENTDPVKSLIYDFHTLATIPPPGTPLVDDGTTGRLGAGGTYVRYWRFDQEALKANASDGSTYHDTGSVGLMAGPWANISSMQADASLNIFSRKDDPDDKSIIQHESRWRIQTKFETPMLNFNYLTTDDITLSDSADTNYKNAVNSVIPRGMWHQFGRLPLEGEGVYMQVTDIPDDWLDNHPSSSVIFDAAGQMDSRNFFGIGAVMPTADEEKYNLTGYRLPINMGQPDGNTGNKVTERPKSLVDICGFSTDPVRIGEVRKRRKLYEAIVAVPFIEEEGERRFFKLIEPGSTDASRDIHDTTVGKSILRQERLMKKYVFPPTFDFIHNKTVEPAAMYIFEFSHKFSTDDLSHMWQNLPPRLGTQAQPAMSGLYHRLLKNQLLNFDSAEVLDAKQKGKDIPKAEFPEKLQWMVFKVKKRAKSNYYKQIDSDKNVEIPFYTDNWPYDFFSMIELASIDTEVTFEPTKRNLNIKKKKRKAANESLSERVKSAKARPIDVNIAEDD